MLLGATHELPLQISEYVQTLFPLRNSAAGSSIWKSRCMLPVHTVVSPDDE